MNIFADVKPVKSDNRYVVRHLQGFLGERTNGADREKIRAAEDSAGRTVARQQELLYSAVASFDRVDRVDGLQPDPWPLLNDFLKPLAAVFKEIESFGTVHDGDMPMVEGE